jgi:hypothetical protein
MDARRFWTEVERKRNAQVVWWLAWPVLGLLVAVGYRSTFGVQAPTAVLWALLALWIAVALFLYHRFSKLQCPRCNRPALQHALFFMRHAKCQHCGLAYVDG